MRQDMLFKVSLEDIAAKAGVHRSTVSLALRDHPRISKEMRVKIQSLAQKMGYRVNPLVAALMQSRRSGKTIRNLVIAYVTAYPTRFGWRPQHHDRPDYFPSAAARAEELGYKLEHFWLAEPGMTPERMSDILTVRNIHGVMLGRLPPGLSELRLLWERFSCVTLGMTLRTPNLHRVAEDHFTSAMRAMEQLCSRGYRRIGFVFSEANDSPRVGEQWMGAFYGQLATRNLAGVKEPLLYEEGAELGTRFAEWFVRNKPDALLVTHAAPVLGWLKSMGLRAPRDVGVATLVNAHPEQGCAGVFCSAEKLGALGTEMLVGLMQRGETGLPRDPHEVLLGGEWLDGRTLPPQPRTMSGGTATDDSVPFQTNPS